MSIKAKRWSKIAAALGTKSAKQVASKAQKEMTKMKKIRKKIPGRQAPGRALKHVANGLQLKFSSQM